MHTVNTVGTKSIRRAAAAFVAGSLITAVSGAVVGLVVKPSTTVPDDRWSYPWSADALVVVSLVYTVMHALIAIGLVGFGRTGAAGRGRASRIGLALAVTGTVVLGVAELASIPVRDAMMDDAGALVVGGMFGLGTLLSAVGFLLLGKATLSAGRWRGWQRSTPLVAGVCTTALVALAFTAALPLAVAAYGLCLLAWAIALYTQPAMTTRDAVGVSSRPDLSAARP